MVSGGQSAPIPEPSPRVNMRIRALGGLRHGSRPDVSVAVTPVPDLLAQKARSVAGGKVPRVQVPFSTGDGLSSARVGLSSAALLDCGDEGREAEMVYWKAVTPADRVFVSPFKTVGRPGPKYVSFEYDNGGWNNIRMAMETSLVLAMGMGRTLVLPPEAPLYLLNKDAKWQRHSFDAFFDIDAIRRIYPDRIISFAEFIARLPPDVAKPTQSLAEMTRKMRQHSGAAYDYLRSIGVQRYWEGGKDCMVFYDRPNVKSVEDMAPETRARMRRFCGSRRVRTYDSEMQSAFLVHFPNDSGRDSRLLAHFYAFVFFGDARMDRWAKRFVRDSLHYKPQIFCQAWKVVKALRDSTPGGKYSAFHIRRNDFQYKEAWLPVPKILNVIRDVIPAESHVYVATDERKKGMFSTFKEHFKGVSFLDTYQGELRNVNKNWYGMIEQIVASRGERFVGTWWSTFTGYINRMRGYHKRDTLSWYYPQNWKNEMQTFKEPNGVAGWWREWPVAWKDIDRP